ncbi:MAG: cardiolipin synthase [Acidobacteriota bacterium]
MISIAIFSRVFVLFFLSPILLTACASLPEVGKLESTTLIPSTPTIRDLDGPLSEEQSRSVLDRLEEQGHLTEEMKEHIALVEAVSDAPLIAGNRVTLYKDAPAAFDAMIESIREAMYYVHLETFIFEDDELGNRFADALIAKRKEGVEVCVLYDSYGSKGTSPEFWDRLREADVKVLEFNPFTIVKSPTDDSLDYRDHRKILVVDGKIAYTGGCNISGVYIPGAPPKSTYGDAPLPWRDMHVKIEGPAATQFQTFFLDTWFRAGGPMISRLENIPVESAGKVLVTVLDNMPGQMNRNAYVLLISAIAHARESIHLIAPYFVPSEELLDSLKDAARRGVDVKIVIPEKTDSDFSGYAGRYYFRGLLKAGVKLYHYKGGMLHAKLAIFDGVWSTVGSSNLDMRSFMTNDEVNASILGRDFANTLEEYFSGELKNSEPLSLRKWRMRPLSERAMELRAHLFERWL